MDKFNKLLLSALILIVGLVAVGFYYVTEINKQAYGGKYTLSDLTGNSNDWTVVNGVSEYTATHPFAASTEAVQLVRASSQRLDATTSAELCMTENFTVKANIRMDADIPYDQDYFIFQNRSVNPNVAGYDIKLQYNPTINDGNPGQQLVGLTGKNTGIVPNTDYKEINGATHVTKEVWHEVAVVYNGTTIKIYLDGVEDATGDWSSGPAYAATTYIHVGCKNNAGTPNQHFDGQITNISVWNRALTPTEISITYYNTLLTGNEVGLVAYWPFQSLSSVSAIRISELYYRW